MYKSLAVSNMQRNVPINKKFILSTEINKQVLIVIQLWYSQYMIFRKTIT